MSYSTVCNAEEAGALKGTGRSGKSQAGAAQELFWSPDGFSFANKASAVTEADWNTAVAAGSLYYIGVIEEFDSNDTEPTFYESANGNIRLKTAEAKRVRQYRLVECSCTHAALISFDGQNGRLFIRTSRGYVQARLENDGTVAGFKTSQFDVGLLTAATSDTPSFTPLDVTFANPVDDDQSLFEDKIDFEFSQIDQIFNADMVVSSVVSGASLTATVVITKDCSEAALTGLVVGDFKATDVNGGVLTISSVTPTANSYAFDIDTTDSLAYIELDGVKTINSLNYVSDQYTVST